MNVDKLNEAEAFNGGSELWVIKNDPALAWWARLDFSSRFLLSQNYFRPKKEIPPELKTIIEAISLETPSNLKLENYVLLGTEDHFMNRWTLVWQDLTDSQLAEILIDLSQKLKFSNIRLFSNTEALLRQIVTRQTASSLNISYIENC